MKIEMPDCHHCKSRSDSLFHFCHLDELDEMNYNKTCSSFKRGQIIFQEGSKPLGIYCLNSGKVKVYKYASDGKEQIIRIAKPGEFIGYSSFLTDKRYPVSSAALEESTVCLIPREIINKLFRDNHNFSDALITLLCSTIENSYEKMSVLAYKPVKGRIAEALLLLQTTYKDSENPNGDINITREDLASLVGTVKETAIRVLKDFKNDHLIETDKTKILVKNPRGLSRVSMLYD
jgi:CRP-like cAMP-binding protein